MIVVFDFGGQYTRLIERGARDLGVQVEVRDAGTAGNGRPDGVTGVILSGSPDSVNPRSLEIVRAVKSWGVPILGICYGHQCLAAATGGTVATQTHREYGAATLENVVPGRLLEGVPNGSRVWMSHGDTVTMLPDGWRVVGRTETGPFAAIEHPAGLFGVQFHPEVTETTYGMRILRNFVLEICQTPQSEVPEDLADSIVQAIQRRVGEHGHALVACSLGVDSTTLTLAANTALGLERVHAVFVDTGLVREEDLALAALARETFLPNLHIVDASQFFLDRLRGVTNRESKRRLVGEGFWDVFRAETERIAATGAPLMVYLQGTLAPDRIESGKASDRAAVIKTHHNLVPPPADFPFPVFEPLGHLYKDQVRVAGSRLGVPREILTRHPFPGPGLAVRIHGEVTLERVALARACDAIWIHELKAASHYDAATQAGVALGQDRASLVRGDEGGDGYWLALWAVVTRDFMTATPLPLPHEFLTRVTDRIGNEVRGIGPVHYRYSSKPPVTVEYE